MMKRRILLCIVHCALCIAASAQTLTLEQARQMALEHNRQAQQAELTQQIAGQAVRQYRAMFLPDVSINAGALYSTIDGSLLYSLLGYKLGAMYSAGATLKQPLYTGGKIRAAYAMAKQGRDMAVQSRRMTRVEVIEKTDEAYVNVLRAGELAKVAERYLEMLAELERNVESAVTLGLKMPADRMRVQVKKNEVELQLRRAQNGLRVATMNLNHVIGQPLDAALPTLCPLEVSLPSGRAGEGAVRPEAELVRQQTEVAAQQLRVARSEVMPQLALMANYGYTRGGELRLLSHSRNVLDGADFNGGVVLTMPLYHFGERTAKIRTAKLKMQMAQLEAADVDEKLELALAQACNNMDEALLEVQLSARALQQAEESLRISRQQYEAGTLTLSDLLDTQALWQQAYEQKIEAQCEQHKALTALQKAQGILQ